MKPRKVDYPVRPCSVCGEEFKPKTFKSELCSHRCRQRRDKGHIPLAEHHAKVRSEAKGRKESRCAHCGKAFTAKAGGWALKQIKEGNGEWGKYCSQQCRYDYMRANPAPAYEFTPVRFAQCKVCGKWFMGKYKQVCSENCERLRYINTVQRKNIGSRTIQCAYCGVWFSQLFKNKCNCCSSECSRKYGNKQSRAFGANHRKRARHYGVDYEPFKPTEIFKRDNWKCRACGVKTPEKLRGSCDPNAPELDHIIPMSTGGGHTRANTQCLCRSCNGSKGNGSLRDQMRLF